MRAAQFSRFGGPEVLELVELLPPHAVPVRCASECGLRA
jgi:hypothetical protein